MPEKKQTVPFSGTKEQEEALLEVIAGLKDEPGALMPILQKAQDIYGYLPMEVQKMISDGTGIPLEKLKSQGQVPDLSLSRDSLLCKGFRGHLQCADGKAGHRRRGVYAGREVFPGCLPLRGGLRTGAGYDGERRGLWTSYGR